MRSCALLLCFALVTLARADPVVLYEKSSEYGNIIVTQDDSGLRILRFEKGGARQSVVKPGDPEYLALPYAPVAFVGLALCGEPRRVLVLGLGGGTLPMFLRKHYPNAVIDAVDIDPQVVHVAREYFGFRDDGAMRAHVADGRRFIEAVAQPYDVIFLDAFGTDSVPPHLATREFLNAVRRAVAPGGVVVGNLWGSGSNRLYDSMVRTYQDVFDDLYILDVRGAENKILLALPRREVFGSAELERRSREVSTARQFRFDLGSLVGYGFLHASARNPDVSVLLDRNLAQPWR